MVEEEKEVGKQRLCTDFFYLIYKLDYGRKYAWQQGKDNKLVKDMMGWCDNDLTEFMKVVLSYRFEMKMPIEKRVYKMRDKKTMTFGFLYMVWNELPAVDLTRICKNCYWRHEVCNCGQYESVEVDNET